MSNPSGNSIDSVAISAASLAAQTAAAFNQGLHVYAVLDPASHPGVWSRFGDLARTRGGASLFNGTSHPSDTTVAPLLLPLQYEDTALQNDLVHIARISPAVIWLASPLLPASLAAKLAAKLHAGLADGQAITLRYQDPRVLPQLLSVFHAHQAAWFHEGIADWWWLDRENRLCHSHFQSPRSPASTDSPWLPAVVLDEPQVRALLDASFIDRVLDVLQRINPGIWQGLERSRRDSYASRLIEAATTWNLESEFDCASYIAVALQLGPHFAEDPNWSKKMNEVKTGRIRFSDAIATWEQRLSSFTDGDTAR